MRLKSSSASVIAGVAAMGMIGAGVASAAPAQSGTPTADYQLCGSVYYDDLAPASSPAPANWPWVSNGAPPTGAEGASGVDVHGTLYDNASAFVADYTTTTGGDGSFCIQGSEDLVSTVTDGGYVVLENDAPSPKNLNKWETTGIDAGDFLSHIYGAFIPPFTFITQAANNFYMVVPR